ncbi:hypothetical protein [Sphaerospermopsis sp. FACHB-1194]|nr:hypothetical protein [Sphaerospermopsis sp. FACHB-1194]MBD2146220.1 hypothetical protein [Sphaerospermopsis sp. FACHB-1194]
MTVKSFLPITNYQSPITNHQSPITNHQFKEKIDKYNSISLKLLVNSRKC